MTDPVRRQSKRLLEHASQPKPVVRATSQPIVKKHLQSSTRKSKTPKVSSVASSPLQTSTISSTATTQEQLVLPDAPAWRAWLDVNESTSSGVWLVLAKKGTTEPTSLNRNQALDEALCSGWIDSQGRSLNQATSLQRYTPRRAKSLWSAINVQKVARLRDEGRMRDRGESEVDRAKEDGRWDRAYAGPSNMTVPTEVVAALEGHPAAKKKLDDMRSMERYALLLPIMTAHTSATRDKKVEKLVRDLSS